MAKGKIIGGIVVGIIVIVGCNAATDDGPDAGTDGTRPATDSKPKTSNTAKKSQADEFAACVDKSGTPTEKAAAKHVTKVTGTDKQNNVLDSAEVYTDFSGGMMGPHQSEGKLIATAFTSCYESENGLVTVYDKDAKILANAQF